jgi:hypothetical protein
MIELLQGFPKRVMAFACKGYVTKRDIFLNDLRRFCDLA